MYELYILFGFMIIAAVVAVGLEDLVSSVVTVSAVGLGLSMVFLILKAPDAAFTQLVVEILCLIILISATIKKDLPFSTSGRWFFNTIATVLFIVLFLGAAYLALSEMPRFGFPIMRVSRTYLNEGFKATGATNMVAAVLLNYRAYDRLGEATVLFAAFVGVLSILRHKGKKNTNDEVKEEA